MPEPAYYVFFYRVRGPPSDVCPSRRLITDQFSDRPIKPLKMSPIAGFGPSEART
jgi:hypothetical protein